MKLSSSTLSPISILYSHYECLIPKANQPKADIIWFKITQSKSTLILTLTTIRPVNTLQHYLKSLFPQAIVPQGFAALSSTIWYQLIPILDQFKSLLPRQVPEIAWKQVIFGIFYYFGVAMCKKRTLLRCWKSCIKKSEKSKRMIQRLTRRFSHPQQHG